MGVCARLVDGIALALFRVASVLLFLMMLIIMLEVIGRVLFGATGGALDIALPGTIELVRHGLLFTIAGALPHMVEDGQVVVDSLTTKLPDALKQRMFAFYLLGFCGFGALLAWSWFHSGTAALEYNDVTQDLRLPTAWLYFGATGCAVVLAVRSALCALRFMRREEVT